MKDDSKSLAAMAREAQEFDFLEDDNILGDDVLAESEGEGAPLVMNQGRGARRFFGAFSAFGSKFAGREPETQLSSSSNTRGAPGASSDNEEGSADSDGLPADETRLEDEVDRALRRAPTWRQVWAEVVEIADISAPVCAMNVMWFARFLVCLAFLGRIGSLQLAAGAMAITFCNVTGYSVLIGLAAGMEPLCTQAHGAQQRHLTGLVLQRCILLLLLSCIPISVLWLNVGPILSAAGQDPSLCSEAALFALWLLPDLIATAISTPLRIFFRSQCVTRPLFAAAGISMAVHVPLNFLLVSVFGLGSAGAALSAGITNWILIIILATYFRCSDLYKKCWQPWSAESLKSWGPLVKMALPSAAMVCLEWWSYELVMLLAGLLPDATRAVASLAIAFNCDSVLYAFVAGMASATCTRVGNLLGASYPIMARHASLVSLWISSLLGVAICGAIWLLRAEAGKLFSEDAKLISHVTFLMPIVGVLELFNSVQTSMGGVLRGSARPELGAYINFGAFYLLGLPLGIVLCFIVELDQLGLVLGLLAAVAVCAFLMTSTVLHTDWRGEAEKASLRTGVLAATKRDAKDTLDWDMHDEELEVLHG